MKYESSGWMTWFCKPELQDTPSGWNYEKKRRKREKWVATKRPGFRKGPMKRTHSGRDLVPGESGETHDALRALEPMDERQMSFG